MFQTTAGVVEVAMVNREGGDLAVGSAQEALRVAVVKRAVVVRKVD